MEFCSPFDDALFHRGPAAVFLRDPEGAWRFDPSWTRDAWQRSPGPHASAPSFVLLRDHATGFVTLALVSAGSLLSEHPRADVRQFASLAEAEVARAAFGAPPVTREAWC